MNLQDGLAFGTLRFAIANSSAGDTIVFNSGLNGAIPLTSGAPLLINKNLIVQGPGANIITISGNNNTRVFSITNASVSLSGLTIANGRVVGTNGALATAGETSLGAGILSLHSSVGYELTVADCAFVQNSVVGGNGGGTTFGGGGAGGNAYGAAIFNNGLLTLENCCFSGNSVAGGNGGFGVPAGGNGGAALGAGVCNVGMLALTNCTFGTNSATGGAGGGTSSGSLTFPGRGGNAEGAGVYNAGQFTILSCTIASNATSGGNGGSGGFGGGGGSRGGAYGGGIRTTDAGTPEMGNTIIAGNIGHQAPDVSGAFASQGFNLVGSTNGSTGFSAMFDQTGTTNNPLNPMFRPLQDNAGPTLTFALLVGSPAIDRGNSFGRTNDQRGAPRPSDFSFISNSSDGSDIGAFELIPPLLNITQFTGDVLLSWSAFNPSYTLQSTTNLPSNNWVSVSDTPVVVAGRCYVTNAMSGRRKFFRLHIP